MTTSRLIFAYDDHAPYQVHCYDAAEYERGYAVIAHDPQRRVDEGMTCRNADEARREALARAARYGERASVVRR